MFKPGHGIKNRILMGALVILAVVVAGIGGYALGHTGGYASGYASGFADGNPDYNKIQASINSTKVNDFGYLQIVLTRLAVDSQNRSVKSPSAGFDKIYSVFKSANASSTMYSENMTFCNPTAKGYFQATATNTGNASFTSLYQTVCLYYTKLANDYTGPLTSFTLQNLSNDFTLLSIDLLKLDSLIQSFPQ